MLCIILPQESVYKRKAEKQMSDVLYEKKGHTALITLNRADTLNALCSSFIASINEALDAAEADEDIYTVILTGSGRAFVAGADISEMYGKTEAEIMEWSALGSNLCMRVENFRLPVIAAVNGYALGGGLELALACDIRIASDNAKFGLPETSLGVICGSGGTQRLPRIVGDGTAREMIFTAKRISASEALDIKLVNRVVSGDCLLDDAVKLCRQIEKNGQLAVQAAKEAVNISGCSTISEGCLQERRLFSALFNTEDQKIGMGGFLAKEKNIKFKNR